MPATTALKPDEWARAQNAWQALRTHFTVQAHTGGSAAEFYGINAQRRRHWVFTQRYQMNDTTQTRRNIFNAVVADIAPGRHNLVEPHSGFYLGPANVVSDYLTVRALGAFNTTVSKDRLLFLQKLLGILLVYASEALTMGFLENIHALILGINQIRAQQVWAGGAHARGTCMDVVLEGICIELQNEYAAQIINIKMRPAQMQMHRVSTQATTLIMRIRTVAGLLHLGQTAQALAIDEAPAGADNPARYTTDNLAITTGYQVTVGSRRSGFCGFGRTHEASIERWGTAAGIANQVITLSSSDRRTETSVMV